jgi:hypothetical protein
MREIACAITRMHCIGRTVRCGAIGRVDRMPNTCTSCSTIRPGNAPSQVSTAARRQASGERRARGVGILLALEDFARAEPSNADEFLLNSVGLHTVSVSTQEQEDSSLQTEAEKPKSSSPPKQKLRPGQQKPKRRAVGLPDEAHESSQGDCNAGEAN